MGYFIVLRSNPLNGYPPQIPFVDAIFEMVSALTTTAQPFLKIEILPKSILLWRSILQMDRYRNKYYGHSHHPASYF